MAMSLGSGGGNDPQPMMEINTTPLIDVMLVLLITLIVTLPPATHAVKLDMPRPTPNQQQNREPVVVDLEIDFDGSYYWNGNLVPDLATLDGYFRQEAQKDPQPELHIKPNRRVKYDYVAQALASAQRNQLLRIGFVGQEQYLED